jgi:hypothetical protein
MAGLGARKMQDKRAPDMASQELRMRKAEADQVGGKGISKCKMPSF